MSETATETITVQPLKSTTTAAVLNENLIGTNIVTENIEITNTVPQAADIITSQPLLTSAEVEENPEKQFSQFNPMKQQIPQETVPKPEEDCCTTCLATLDCLECILDCSECCGSCCEDSGNADIVADGVDVGGCVDCCTACCSTD